MGRERERIVSALFILALPFFGTCVTSVETLEVQCTLASKLVHLLPWWMKEWAPQLWWSIFGKRKINEV